MSDGDTTKERDGGEDEEGEEEVELAAVVEAGWCWCCRLATSLSLHLRAAFSAR